MRTPIPTTQKNGTHNTDSTTARAPRGIRLGEILVEQGLLTRDQVREVLAEQQRQGRPFGVLAERLFDLDPAAVEAAWVRQYATLAGTTDPRDLDVDPECAAILSRRQAWQFHLAVVCREDGELVLLTDERHLARALRFAAATFEEPTFIRIADADDLHDFLMGQYPVPQFLASYATAR